MFREVQKKAFLFWCEILKINSERNHIQKKTIKNVNENLRIPIKKAYLFIVRILLIVILYVSLGNLTLFIVWLVNDK